MRTRVGAPTLVGGVLVILVAIATVVVTWLLWTRADDREQARAERAAQSVNEALQNNVGQVLTSLRASAGLVKADGNVDTASFEAFARAVASIGVADVLALARMFSGPSATTVSSFMLNSPPLGEGAPLLRLRKSCAAQPEPAAV